MPTSSWQEASHIPQTNKKVYPSVDCRDIVPHCWWRRDPSFRELGCLSSFGLLVFCCLKHTSSLQLTSHNMNSQLRRSNSFMTTPPCKTPVTRSRQAPGQTNETKFSSLLWKNMEVNTSQTTNQGNSVAGGEPNDYHISSESHSERRQHGLISIAATSKNAYFVPWLSTVDLHGMNSRPEYTTYCVAWLQRFWRNWNPKNRSSRILCNTYTTQ